MKKMILSMLFGFMSLNLMAEVVAPEWYDAPETLLGEKAKYYRVGAGDSESLQRSMSIDKAKLKAYASLVEQIQTSVKSYKELLAGEKSVIGETGTNSALVENAGTAASSMAEGVIKNLQVLKQTAVKEGNKYYGYVVIAMPDTLAESLYLGELKKQAKASNLELGATKTLEAMEIKLKDYCKVLESK